MTCTCPKCHQKIELDLPEVTEAGTTAVCPACNTRFSVYKESFGGRALRKSSEISCATCGNELGCGTHCSSCGAQFPDYLVASLNRKRARRQLKKIKLKTSPFPQKQKAMTQLPSLGMSMKPDAAAQQVERPESRIPRPMLIGISLLVVVAMLGAGTMYYLKNKAETSYAKNFVLATYCVQTGIDRAFKASAKMSADWKAKSDAGLPYTARISADDDRDFALISSKLDLALTKIATPPEKFAVCNEKLGKLQTVFTKGRALLQAPGYTLQGLVDATNKLDGEYKQATKEYKSGMPVEVMQELVSASLKLKGFRPLLNQ